MPITKLSSYLWTLESVSLSLEVLHSGRLPPCWQILDQAEKACPEKNTLAYFAASSVTKKKLWNHLWQLVYVDFQVGEEEPLPGVGEHLTAMTQVINHGILMEGDSSELVFLCRKRRFDSSCMHSWLEWLERDE
jgi:hypothetical protein